MKKRFWTTAALAIGPSVLAALVRWPLDPLVGDGAPFLTFFIAVVVVAWSAGRVPALWAVLLGGAFAWFLFMSPRYSFGPKDSAHTLLLVQFVVVGLVIAFLGGAVRAALQRVAAAERIASSQRENFRRMLLGMGDAIVAIGNSGRIEFLNTAAEALTGWSDADAANQLLRSVVALSDTSGQSRGHAILTARAGTTTPVDFALEPMRDGSGHDIGTIIVLRDATERLRAEAVVRESAAEVERHLEFHEAVTRHMEEGLYTTNARGYVTYVNPAAERLLGWSSHDLLGRRMHDVIHYKYPDGTPFPFEQSPACQVARTGRPVQDQEEWFIRRDGTLFPVSYSASPLKRGSEIDGIVTVFRDNSDRQSAASETRFFSLLRDVINSAAAPPELLDSVLELIAGHFRVSRAAYNRVLLKENRVVIERDFSSSHPSVAGSYTVGQLPAHHLEDAVSGRITIIKDTRVDARTAAQYESQYLPLGIRSYVHIPIIRDGLWVAGIWIGDFKERDWNTNEVAFLRRVADQLWLAFEHARLFSEMKASEERLRLA